MPRSTNAWGVWAAQRSEGKAVTIPAAAATIAGDAGVARIAPPTSRAAPMSAGSRSAGAKGRAAACTRTIRSSPIQRRAASSPFDSDSWRVAPPDTISFTFRPAPSSIRRSNVDRSPSETTRSTRPTSGAPSNSASDQASIGRPPSGSRALFRPAPMRRPSQEADGNTRQTAEIDRAAAWLAAATDADPRHRPFQRPALEDPGPEQLDQPLTGNGLDHHAATHALVGVAHRNGRHR